MFVAIDFVSCQSNCSVGIGVGAGLMFVAGVGTCIGACVWVRQVSYLSNLNCKADLYTLT